VFVLIKTLGFNIKCNVCLKLSLFKTSLFKTSLFKTSLFKTSLFK